MLQRSCRAVVEYPIGVDDILVDDPHKLLLDSSELFFAISRVFLPAFPLVCDVIVVFEVITYLYVQLHVVEDVIPGRNTIDIWLLHAIEFSVVGKAWQAYFVILFVFR